MTELAMFPLGRVLFPGALLPLHVFEPRYRAMVEHLLTPGVEPEFGVVLIERGSEVGGGDVRGSVGTVARIVQASARPEGTYALVAAGTRVITVRQWLPDDPYPRAEVDELVDPPVGPAAAAAAEQAIGSVRTVLALLAELVDPAAPATVELADDPTLAVFQASSIAPLGPLDQLHLLSTRGLQARAERLTALMAEQAEVARLRLAEP